MLLYFCLFFVADTMRAVPSLRRRSRGVTRREEEERGRPGDWLIWLICCWYIEDIFRKKTILIQRQSRQIFFLPRRTSLKKQLTKEIKDGVKEIKVGVKCKLFHIFLF